MVKNIPELDVAVVGFGPAGIAFACAVADEAETLGHDPLGTVRCFEKSATTTWHGDFLLQDTDINHHIFRDLATPRNPRSRFSFAMYLKDRGRLYKFGLLGRPPSRAEWSDYIIWVAAQLADYAAYGEGVTALVPVSDGGALQHIKVVTTKREYLTKTVILSSGSYPNIPDVFVPHVGSHVFHTSEYLPRLRAFRGRLPHRWLVVGSGQSAGEAVAHLLGHDRSISVDSIHRSSGFNVGQLGQFPNLAFLPEQVDQFHRLAHKDRLRFLADVRAINYAGIDTDQSQGLYSLMYEDGIHGKERLRMFPFSQVQSVRKSGDAYGVSIRDAFSGEERLVETDGIVLGTGFEKPKVPPVLAEMLPWMALAEDGGAVIARDYRLALHDAGDVAIYANGLSERTHGISDTQSFSLLAVRSGQILSSLFDARRHPEQPPAHAELELV